MSAIDDKQVYQTGLNKAAYIFVLERIFEIYFWIDNPGSEYLKLQEHQMKISWLELFTKWKNWKLSDNECMI